jgi:hypothetical protein
MKAVYNAYVGAPFYSNYPGVIYWDGNQAFVFKVSSLTPIENSEKNVICYYYDVDF